VISLLSQRNFFLLWAAHTISILGDYVFFIAITFWIYEQTGSAFATGLVLMASTVPAILFAPLAGAIVDRWDRRSIMLAAESARGLLFLGLLGILIVEPHALWPIYVAGFLQSALATFFWTARSALLPQMVEPPSLLAANAVYMVSDSGVRLIAPSLSTFALLHLGAPGVVIIDTASFVISAGSICFLASVPLHRPKAVSPPGSNSSSITFAFSQESLSQSQPVEVPTKREQGILTGIDVNARIRGLFFLGSVVAYTAGTLSILFPIFVQTMLSAGPLAYGWILTTQAIGEGAMSVLLERMQARGVWLGVSGFVSACLAAGGLTLMLLVCLHALGPCLLLNLIFGAMTAGTTIRLLTCLQQHVANRFLGRVLATYSAIQALTKVGGIGVASVTVASTGVTWLLVFDGALYLLGSGLAWVLLAEGKRSVR